MLINTTYPRRHLIKLFEAVIEAPFPGNKSTMSDCTQIVNDEVLTPTIFIDYILVIV